MDWSLVVNGFLGDAEKTAELFERIKGILSNPNYGTTNSQFWGQGIQESAFHTDSAAATDPAADPAPPATPPAGDAEQGSQEPGGPSPEGAPAADGSEPDADPIPAP